MSEQLLAQKQIKGIKVDPVKIDSLGYAISPKSLKKVQKKTSIPMLQTKKVNKEKPKSITKGTLTVLKRNQKSVNPGLLMHFSNLTKNELSDQAKLKLKWKTIQYLIENKKCKYNKLLNYVSAQIDMLTRNIKSLFREIKNESFKEQQLSYKRNHIPVKQRKVKPRLFFQKQEEKQYKLKDFMKGQQTNYLLNRQQFSKLLCKIGLGSKTQKNLVDKLFWVFDQDGNGQIDHKELAVGLQLLSDSPFEKKIQTDDGIITEPQIYQLLKISLINYDDRSRLKKILARIFKMCKEKDDTSLEDLVFTFIHDPELKELLNKNSMMLKQVDHWIDSDLQKPFHTRISFSMDNTNSKLKGIFFPQLNRLVQAFKEKEDFGYRQSQFKLKNNLELRRIRGKQELNPNDSEDFSEQ